MNSFPSPSLLVIGGPAVGKTVYGSQVLARLRHAPGALSLRGPPANIAPFERALGRLSQGLAPEHTGAATYHELVLPLRDVADQPIDLVWPDYGGEQIREIVEQRQVTSAWQTRVQSASGWILFVRLDRVRRSNDVITRPPENMDQRTEVLPIEAFGRTKTDEPLPWSEAAKLVELLQVLLFLRRVGFIGRIAEPPLCILLSCWDEFVDEPLTPAEELRCRLPLLANFIESAWDPDSVDIIGLSAQGRPLSGDRIDEEYVDQGPEHFGYVVLPNGQRVADLTRPVARLLRRTIRPEHLP
jgi:hypothetical protein